MPIQNNSSKFLHLWKKTSQGRSESWQQPQLTVKMTSDITVSVQILKAPTKGRILPAQYVTYSVIKAVHRKSSRWQISTPRDTNLLGIIYLILWPKRTTLVVDKSPWLLGRMNFIWHWHSLRMEPSRMYLIGYLWWRGPLLIVWLQNLQLSQTYLFTTASSMK